MTCTATRHTNGTYAKGRCTCEIGRAARSRYCKLYRNGRNPVYRIPVLGSRRRVQGLMAQGWNCEQIAAAAGLTDKTAPQLMSHICVTRQYVTIATARAVRRAVARLGDHDGPSTHVRNRAANRGYVPLEAWAPGAIDDPAATPWPETVDEVAIERAVRMARHGLGQPTGLSKTEYRLLVARLASAPCLMHDSLIATRLHRSQSWVTATRERAGVPRVAVRAAPGRKAA
jgi:hypothetical protein